MIAVEGIPTKNRVRFVVVFLRVQKKKKKEKVKKRRAAASANFESLQNKIDIGSAIIAGGLSGAERMATVWHRDLGHF